MTITVKGYEFMHTVLMIFIVSSCTLASQLILKKGVIHLLAQRNFEQFSLTFMMYAIKSPLIWISIVIQCFGFSLWIFVLTREKLGAAFGYSGAFFYLLLPLFTWMIYGEKLTVCQWAGLVLISSGVILMLTK